MIQLNSKVKSQILRLNSGTEFLELNILELNSLSTKCLMAKMFYGQMSHSQML